MLFPHLSPTLSVTINVLIFHKIKLNNVYISHVAHTHVSRCIIWIVFVVFKKQIIMLLEKTVYA